jgi:hypothetical protein
MRWSIHVAYMVNKRNAYKMLVGKSERKTPIGRTGVDGRIILK